jgi:hypothetical protein
MTFALNNQTNVSSIVKKLVRSYELSKKSTGTAQLSAHMLYVQYLCFVGIYVSFLSTKDYEDKEFVKS